MTFADRVEQFLTDLGDVLATTPPFSWMNTVLSGFVGPEA